MIISHLKYCKKWQSFSSFEIDKIKKHPVFDNQKSKARKITYVVAYCQEQLGKNFLSLQVG